MPPAQWGARVIGQSTEMPCPYYHRVFLFDFSITKQTIVAISQRTHIIISAKPKLPSVTDLLYLQRYRS